MKILVTGGAGFIGSHLVDALISKGHQVRIYDNLEPQTHSGAKKPKYLNKKAEFIKGDVRNKSDLAKAVNGVEAVYHLAAAVGIGQSMYQVKKYAYVNVGGVANLLEILTTTRNKVKKVVFASSATAYGEGTYNCLKNCGIVFPEIRTEGQIKKGQWEYLCPNCGGELVPIPTKETKPLRSQFLYAISKDAGEKMLLGVGKAYGIPCTVLRFFNVFGPRQSLTNPHTAVFAVFMARIKEDKPPLIIEDGNQTRDFIFVDDVVRANLKALYNKKSDFEVFNIGSGRPITIRQVAKELIKLSGKELKPKINYIFRKGDVRHCFANIDRAKQLLGWQPRVSFEAGVKKMYNWALGEESKDTYEDALKIMVKKGLTAKKIND